MRILITVDPEIPVPPKTYGGIERIVDWLARGMQSLGHTVALAANVNSTCKVEKIYKWRMNNSRLFPEGVICLNQLRECAFDFKPDIIHSFSRIFYLLGTYDFSCSLIMSYQRHPSTRSVALANRIFGSRIKFTGCSDYISKIGSTGGGRWFSIHNGVEIKKYEFNQKISSDAPLVFLSRIEEIKGLHIAIKIAQKSGRRLLIAGNHSPHGEGAYYWKNIIQPQIDGRFIQYVGPADDELKKDLLSQAYALLVPVQWDEPFGIVFAEALACGTPVISCPKGALPEIVVEGENGFLIQDIEEGVKAVNQIASISRLNCRKHAEERFSSDVLVRKYEKIYFEN
jgi:glycosyltransferase involved in cell wall biosynthesis